MPPKGRPARASTPATHAKQARDRKAWMKEIEGDLAAARADGSHTSIVGLLRLLTELRGLNAPPPPAPRKVATSGDPLTDHLAELREMQALAVERGSVDAAARISRQVRQAIKDLEARDEAKKAAELASMSPEEQLAMLIDITQLLPLPHRRRLIDSLG